MLSERSPLTQGCCEVSTVIGILASLIIGPCRHGKTDDRQHYGDGESERHAHGGLAGEAQCKRVRIKPQGGAGAG